MGIEKSIKKGLVFDKEGCYLTNKGKDYHFMEKWEVSIVYY